jgi:hypothetical protein
VPQFTLTLLGGVLADRVDARKLIRAAQANSAIAMIIVGAATMLGVAQLWHLALGAFLVGMSGAIDEPARAAFFPRLLPRPLLRSAVPLISMAFGSSRVIAPSIAGFLIAAAGAPSTFSRVRGGRQHDDRGAVPGPPGARRGAFARQPPQQLHREPALHTPQRGFRQGHRRGAAQRHAAMGYHHMLPVFAKDVLQVDSRGLGIPRFRRRRGALTGSCPMPGCSRACRREA